MNILQELKDFIKNHKSGDVLFLDPGRIQAIIESLARKGISKPVEGWKNLIERLRDDTGCSQGTCLSCTKGFENHEYNCTEGEHCLDSVAVLKRTRKRLRKLALEAADALSASPSQPIEGWKMVPVEPTEAMIEAGSLKDWIGHPEAKQESIDRWRTNQRQSAIDRYRAMISASPSRPIEGGERRDALEEALRPFAEAFENARYSYSLRYRDHMLGLKNFDKMPDNWPMEKLQFNMGTYRRAAEALASPAPLSESLEARAALSPPVERKEAGS